MRITIAHAIAAIVSAGLAAPAFADKLSTPQEAIDTITRYCVDTGAKADKLEAVLKSVRLPQHAIQVDQRGDVIDMRLRLDDNQKIELNYRRGGHVAMCTYRTFLEDAAATFALAKKRFGLKGTMADYDTTDVNIEPIASPPGSSLHAFGRIFQQEKSKAGTLTFNVLVDPPAN